MMKKYTPQEIEPRWQQKWRDDKIYNPDIDSAKNPFYNLMMFPYPSAEGLHIGNMSTFSGIDVFGRMKRMQGFDVFEPIGLDGFGIHSENYALKIGRHPMDLSKETEKHYYEQLQMIGNSYDWTRTVETYKPNYYKWTQWLFLQLYKKGLAYRAKAEVNWCPSCKTVLSDEQVLAGECERCGSKVEKRMLEQWFFKITDYADKLLANLDQIDWSQKVKIAQRNWIGKSSGAQVKFDDLEVFTTRPDTLFGVTFMVISPEHQLLNQFIKPENKAAVDKYLKEVAQKTEEERIEAKDKTGVFTGSFVKNPLSGEDVPVWVADYVLAGYGTGAIMAVPAHDQRDFEFAKKFDLPIKQVIKPNEGQKQIPFAGEGLLINSDEFNDLPTAEAREKIVKYLEDKKIGSAKTQYHLRDWLISRQRYWGPPIPIIYCEKCGIVPVPEEDLPVELPYVEDFRPMGTGQSPLAQVEEFYKVKCPNCGGEAKRETDVSDTFLDSSWYFLRYPSTDIENKPFDIARTRKWLPVHSYIGGAEHAVLHLLYARFVTMVLHDLGLIDFEEPFKQFRHHGLVIREGAKMSKSKGNVVNPDDYIKEYGADTLRLHLLFSGVFQEGGNFQDEAVNGIYRFIHRSWKLLEKVTVLDLSTADLMELHKAVKKVGEDIAELKFNTAIAALMEWLNYLSRKDKVAKDEYKPFLLLLAPFAPHITEELWGLIGENYSIHTQKWPEFDPSKIKSDQIKIVVQVNSKVRDLIEIAADKIEDKEFIIENAKQSSKVDKFLQGQQLKKTIYVPGKVLNFVT